MRDLEAVYDAEISPLMAQIIAVCKREGMPMVASFQCSDDGLCTSCFLPSRSEDTPEDRQAREGLRMGLQIIKDGVLPLIVRHTAAPEGGSARA